MEFTSINDVIITPLKIINNIKGDIFHALKSSDKSFNNFGEAYFSEIFNGDIKGWKKHLKMTLNIIVPIGDIEFYLVDDRLNKNKFYKTIVGRSNYVRLTIPPNIWVAFKGIGSYNMLLNIADIEHDINETENLNLEYFKIF